MKIGSSRLLEVEHQTRSDEIVFRKRGSPYVRSHEVGLNSPVEAPTRDPIVQSAARQECGVGIAAQSIRLRSMVTGIKVRKNSMA